MTEKKTVNKSNQGKVLIKKEAFRNMVTHVLRFASVVLENSVEVLGICLGKYNDIENKVVIENAIPITHGEKVEIGFDKEMYELFAQIEKKYSSQLIGYYHSHPSWGLYLSESDQTNIQFFQNEKFPQGFCIVFDHKLMGFGDGFGFDVFRLDDYTKTDKYSSVSYEIEIPSTLDYFKWIQKFMEDFQKKSPILIKEINEFVEKAPEDLQEIPTSEDLDHIEEELQKFPERFSIISGFKQGSEQFSDTFIHMLQNQLGDWINDIELGTSRGTEYITKAVDRMKQAVVSGFLKVNGWFKKTLNEAIYDFMNSVYKYIDTRIEEHKHVTEEISEVKKRLISNLNILIENKIKNIEMEIEDLANKTIQQLDETKQINLRNEKDLDELKTNLKTISTQSKNFTEDFEVKMETSINPFKTNLDEKINKLSMELEPFKNNYSEIRILLEKLQKIITEFRNLT
ncbi:MAG: hypothetical protein ACFE9C_03090 [Candidatus Hodarchaeota archaeon]